MNASWYRVVFFVPVLLFLAGTVAVAADPPLLTAVRQNDYAKVRSLLRKSTPRDTVTVALFYAAAYKAAPAIVSLVLQHGADVNARTDTHATPLHYAAFNSTPAVIALLLRRGANIDATDQNLDTPLEWAARKPNSAAVKYLLEHGANGPNALVHETYDQKPQAVRALLDAGVDVNARSQERGREGMTAVIEAAFMNDIGLVRMLLERGADVNAVQPGDANMTTALMFAAYRCNSQMIQLLASHGARDTIRANGSNAYDLARTGWTNTMQPCNSDVLSQLSDLQ